VDSVPAGNDLDMTDHDKQLDEDRKQLEHLEEEIQEVRSHTPDYKMEHEQHFIDPGARDDIEDNTIAPG
jgi:hypothetical protein